MIQSTLLSGEFAWRKMWSKIPNLPRSAHQMSHHVEFFFCLDFRCDHFREPPKLKLFTEILNLFWWGRGRLQIWSSQSIYFSWRTVCTSHLISLKYHPAPPPQTQIWNFSWRSLILRRLRCIPEGYHLVICEVLQDNLGTQRINNLELFQSYRPSYTVNSWTLDSV